MKHTLLIVASLLATTLSAQKAQVWDFGAEQLDNTKYQNMLSVSEINSWYDTGVTAGSERVAIASFTASDSVNLVFNGAGKDNHRLRTTNTQITRWDSRSLTDAAGTEYKGYLYSNAGSTPGVYFEQSFEANDMIEYFVGSNGGAETYEFLSPSGDKVQGKYTAAAKIEKLTFYAKENGKYRIYGLDEKLVVARIIRTPAQYATLTGSVTAAAGIPDGYGIIFKNLKTETETVVTPASDAYSATLALGYDYEVSLKDANGYVISSESTVKFTADNQKFDITISGVSLVTVSGTITGLPAAELTKVDVEFAIPEDKSFVPELTIDRTAGTFSVVLEKDVEYGVTVLNVNDYETSWKKVSATTDTYNIEFPFTKKPLYEITIVPTGATAAELANAVFTFTRLDDNYVYSFTGTVGIELRDGVYTVKVSNSGAYSQLLTSNLKVNGAATSIQIDFSADISRWNFSDADFTEGGYTDTKTAYTYKTLQFTGCKSHNNTYLYAGNGAEIKVPVKGNSIITVNACYEYHLFVGTDTLGDTKTGSTSQIDALTYAYNGPAGFVTITATGTCYINSIDVDKVTEYKPTLTVGKGKDYETIGEAIEAISQMKRTEDERVTVLIEPGNYEEMLRIHSDNVTLKNAASTPSLNVKDGGVNIDGNAVRITSYYGHGYNYYSMNSDYMWDARTLRVNKENGYTDIVNSGGSSATHWNSTVVVYGDNFEAEDIIFENSYNQYISKKESEDIVVEGAGSKGVRPTDEGNTSVQNRSFRERACALAFAKGSDKGFLKNCRIIGRQDALFGDNGVRVAVDGGILNGACDYIFGGMTLAVRKAELAMLVTSDKNDVAYITASKTEAGKRGYLFWECTVTSAKPSVDMVETKTAQPGLWGRPWDKNAETVFYKTTVEADGEKSLIQAAGWGDGLVAGGSDRSYEYGTVEKAGVDNSASRVSWATVLTKPALPDGTAITLKNFTMGTDDWNPFNEEETVGVENVVTAQSGIAQKVVIDGRIYILREGKKYTITGAEVK